MKTNLIKTLLATGVLTCSGLNQGHAQSYNDYGTYNGQKFYGKQATILAQSSTATFMFEGGFTAYSSTLHTWTSLSSAERGYHTTDLNPIVTTSATSVTSVLVWGGTLNGQGGDPFGVYNPADSGTFYAGTYNGQGTSALWTYNGPGKAWTNHGPFGAPYGAATSKDGEFPDYVFIAGLTGTWSGSYGQNTNIVIYPNQSSGTSEYQVIIEAAGNSANVAVDGDGNVYYAEYARSGPTYLRKWDARAVGTAITSGTHLTYTNATILCTLPGPGNGITADAGGNVFFSTGGTANSGIYMWNTDLVGTGTDYIKVAAVNSGSPGDLDSEGDVVNGGFLYAGTTRFGGSDFTIITLGTPLPQPAAARTAVAAAPVKVKLNAAESAYVRKVRQQ
ncbi:MAG: hypothetical protein LBK76_06510, partial [Verrucomicrobiales bacterium]|nr:hypothetical protein [Verrucomicrobiales bacterium]